MIVLVCGGRDYEDKQRVFRTLSNIHETHVITKVIAGGAKGADTFAITWAWTYNIRLDIHPAQWKKHGKAAGPIRNAEMLDAHPDVVVAFPGGKGTENMISQAKSKNVKVWVIEQ